MSKILIVAYMPTKLDSAMLDGVKAFDVVQLTEK